MKQRLILAILAILAAGAALLLAATLPAAAPVHSGLSQGQLLGYIADNTQRWNTGSGVATLPAAAPVHSGLSQGQLLGYIADSVQDLANNAVRVYVPSGVAPNDGADDKAGIQAAIDACYTAGGGVVFMNEGVWDVSPLGTGIGLLLKTGVQLRGAGPGTIIRFTSTTASSPFEGIAPFGYNTTTGSYGAHELDIADLTVECDGYLISADASHTNAHGLIGVIHCPKATIRNVTFGNIHYHQLEIQRAKNVLVEHCDFKGNTESERLQFDSTGNAGARSGTPPNLPLRNITIRNCRFAGRDITGQSLGIARNITLSHTTATTLDNVLFEGCEFGPVYAPASTGFNYSLSFDTQIARCENLTIRNCRFLGDCGGLTYALDLVPGTTAALRNIVIDNNVWGAGYDCNGTWFAGGFGPCLIVGTATYGTAVTGGGGGVITGHLLRQGIRVTNNVFRPRWVNGYSTAATGPNFNYVVVGSVGDAVIEGNQVILPPYGSDWTFSGSTLTSTAEHEFEIGDPVRLLSTGTLPTGLAPATTYYVVETAAANTFKLSATPGGSAITPSAGSGTHSWITYTTSLSLGYTVGYSITEVRNLRFLNNTLLAQHKSTGNGAYTAGIYSQLLSTQGLETGTIPHSFVIEGNRVHSEVGTLLYGLFENSTGSAYGSGRVFGNSTQGTFSNTVTITGHPMAYQARTALNLAGGVTTFAPTSATMTMTASGAATIGTITKGTDGMILTLSFGDSNITITDTDAATANTVNLSAAFTGTANDSLTLRYDGTKWHEVSRAVN